MSHQNKLKNLKGYIILLLSFIGLMILKELEVWSIKKVINQSNPEILNVQ